MSAATLAVVRSWHEAMNARDADRLVGMAHDDVEVAGPRGAGRGRQLLREWVARQLGEVGLHLEALRFFARDDTVVVEQRAEWRAAGTGEAVEALDLASVFVVRDGLVAAYARHPDLPAALHAAGLGHADEVRPG